MPNEEETTLTPGDESGRGGEPETETLTPDYAGFQTPDELVTDYQRLKDEVEQLGSLKGRLGNEVGEAREAAERYRTMYERTLAEATQRAAAPANTGPASVDEIERMVDAGELSYGEGLKMAASLIEQSSINSASQKVQEELARIEQDRLAREYIQNNPGYLEAWNSGELKPYIDEGLTGQHAYDRYKLVQLDKEREALKQQLEDKIRSATETGVQTGIQLEKGKSSASRVIGSPSSGIENARPDPQFFSKPERLQAARDYLARKRSGTG